MVGLIDVPNSPLGLLCGGSHPTDPRRSLGIVVARLDFCGPVTTKLQSAMQICSIGGLIGVARIILQLELCFCKPLMLQLF